MDSSSSLIESAQSGDETAFREFVARTANRPSGCTCRIQRAPILHAIGLVVLTLAGDRISSITHFETSLLSPFGLPRMEAVTEAAINLPDPNCLVHLQFRRFVDCPICNTHIAEYRKRTHEIESAGIKEVIVFHSSPKSIRTYQKDVPFLLVGDPRKVFYKEFGVETSIGFASPKALKAASVSTSQQILVPLLLEPQGQSSVESSGSSTVRFCSADK